MHTKTAHIL